MSFFPSMHAIAARAYEAEGRAYHDSTHLDEVLARYEEVARDVGWTQAREVYVALLFHDAVYVPGQTDNEARSADMAADAIEREGIEGIDIARVRELILLTARHGKLEAVALDADAALVLDCDMAILGAEAERYDAYERAIRTEYAAVPDEMFDMGRRRFLSSVLAGRRIYLSEYFFGRLEGRARANLTRVLGA